MEAVEVGEEGDAGTPALVEGEEDREVKEGEDITDHHKPSDQAGHISRNA